MITMLMSKKHGITMVLKTLYYDSKCPKSHYYWDTYLKSQWHYHGTCLTNSFIIVHLQKHH